MKTRYEHLLRSFLELTPSESGEFHFPEISQKEVSNLCVDAIRIFSCEPNVLRLVSPAIIVGDIHGHFGDMLAAIQKHGIDSTFLFLGDIVDRGPYSAECALFLLLLKVCHPRSVYVTRGNHEFMDFSEEFENTALIIKAFEHAPLCAVIDSEVFCVHGGIGPSFESIEQIKQIRRPVADFKDPVVAELLWSDPEEEMEGFGLSPRRIGSLYGAGALKEFLELNHLKKLVRAHQYVKEGIVNHFDGAAVTVFSASDYLGRGNDGKTLVVEKKQEVKPVIPTVKPFSCRPSAHSNKPIERIAIPGTKRRIMAFHLASTPPPELKRPTLNAIPKHLL